LQHSGKARADFGNKGGLTPVAQSVHERGLTNLELCVKPIFAVFGFVSFKSIEPCGMPGTGTYPIVFREKLSFRGDLQAADARGTGA
jgi:hypothetical protein